MNTALPTKQQLEPMDAQLIAFQFFLQFDQMEILYKDGYVELLI